MLNKRNPKFKKEFVGKNSDNNPVTEEAQTKDCISLIVDFAILVAVYNYSEKIKDHVVFLYLL